MNNKLGAFLLPLSVMSGITARLYGKTRIQERQIARLQSRIREGRTETQKMRELKQIARDAENYIQENQILHSENQMAARIQNSMIPKMGVLDSRENFEVYADIDFAKEVGGDYYDYFHLDENRVCLSVGDVSGKGVPAVIYMVAAKLLLKNYLQRGSGIAETYKEVNRELFHLAAEKQFVTSFTGILDVRTGEMAYVNAGHTPPLLMEKSGKVHRLTEKSGLPLGAYYSAKRPELMDYRVCHVQLNEGDTFFVYTDGCSEAVNRKGELMGMDGLEELLRGGGSEISLEELVRYVQRRIIAFEDHEEQDDDCTVMGVRWGKSGRSKQS